MSDEICIKLVEVQEILSDLLILKTNAKDTINRTTSELRKTRLAADEKNEEVSRRVLDMANYVIESNESHIRSLDTRIDKFMKIHDVLSKEQNPNDVLCVRIE